jgi:hypothetical protein
VLFASAGLSRTTADLTPPFEPDESGKVGSWETGGSSLVDVTSIMLVPPIQYHKGYVWTNAAIPHGTWSLDLEFEIPETDGGGAFGIWIISTYGADGALCGGPTTFAGLGVVAQVLTFPGESDPRLTFRVLQRGEGASSVYDRFLPSSIATLPFSTSEPFTVRLHFESDQFSLSFNGQRVHTTPLLVDISSNYIGVTAASDRRFARIDLRGASFLIDTPLAFRYNTFLGENKPSGRVERGSAAPLKRAAFTLTATELSAMRGSGGVVSSEASIDRLFDVIQEVHAANFDVASFADLSAFVDDKVLKYAQKWQLRTATIVERIRQAKNVTGAAWDYTGSIMQTFNASVKDTVLRTAEKIGDIDYALKYFADVGIDEGGGVSRTADEVNKANVIRVIMWVVWVEFAGVICFFVIANLPMVKDRLFGAV